MHDSSASVPAQVRVSSGITVEQRSNSNFIRCSGILDEAGAEELRKVVEPLIVSGDACSFVPVTLDMAEVDSCTPEAVEVLMFLKEKAAGCLDDRGRDRQLFDVVHAPETVRDVLNSHDVLHVQNKGIDSKVR